MLTRRFATVPIVAIALFGLAACGSSGSKSSSAPANRPSTTARLAIVSPTPNQVVAPDVTLQFELIGAKVVQATTAPHNGTEGHIHVSLDGKLVSMAFGTTQDLHGLTPGPHTVRAEFVATDHQPFANPVVTAVLFQVHS